MGIVTGAIVAGVAGSAISAGAQSSAASDASAAQVAATQMQIDAQREALDESRALLQPYVNAGDAAMQEQLNLLGLGGYYEPIYEDVTTTVPGTTQGGTGGILGGIFGGRAPFAQGIHGFLGGGITAPTTTTTQKLVGQRFVSDPNSQQSAIDKLANDPLYLAKVRQGEDAILQNASATGGLRGGNIQGALAQYRPQMLNQEIEQRLNRLGGIAALGQNAAAGVGNAAQYGANQISNAYGAMGSAQAGNALAQGQSTANMMSGITGNLSNYAMMQGLGLFGGGGGSTWGTTPSLQGIANTAGAYTRVPL